MPGNDRYPLCDVAQYFVDLGQPGEGRATYLYAHARDGMFGPIYELAIPRRQGEKMVGMLVQVYTSDDRLYLYEITDVRLHQTSLADAVGATTEELWLQTSEGPRGTVGKTQLLASHSRGPRGPGEAHPSPKPVVCGWGHARGHSPQARRRAGQARPPQIQSIRRSRATVTTPSRTIAPVTSQKPGASRSASTEPASLIPKIPATAPMPASTTVTPVSRFMIVERRLLTVDR